MGALLGIGLMVAIPGIGASVALYPPDEHLPLPTRLALAAALGYVVAGGLAYLLALVHLLVPVAYFVLLAGVTVGFVLVAVRGRGPREAWLGLGRRMTPGALRSAFPSVLREPWVVLGFVVVAAVCVFRLARLPAFQSEPAAFRYWLDGVELADAHRVPTLTVQYARLFPPAISKIFLSSFHAGASFVARSPLSAIDAVLGVAIVGLALSFWSLGWELGLRATAPLLSLLVVSNRVVLGHELTTDLGAFRAEVTGRFVAVAGAAMAIRAVRTRRWRDALVAGVVLGCGMATHLVPVVAVGLLVGFYAVGLLLAERTVAAVKGVAKAAAMVVVTAILLGLAILVLPPGDIGLHPGGSPTVEAPGHEPFDPGLYLRYGRFKPPSPPSQHWYVEPNQIFQSYLESALGVSNRDRLRSLASNLRIVLPVAGLLLAVVILFLFPMDMRALGVAAWGMGIALFVGAAFFAHHYKSYIPATFGFRRLFDYASIPLFLVGLAMIELVVVLLHRARWWLASAVGALVLVLALITIMPSGAPQNRERYRDSARMLSWIRVNTPCDARLLVNQRSAGVFRLLTGRIGILEGMAPYLRPGMTSDVLAQFLEARAFYQHPLENRSFLEREHADYVIVVREFLGIPGPIGRVNVGELRQSPFLELVFDSPRAQVYRIVGLAPIGSVPDLSGAPRIHCRGDPR